MPIPNTNDPGVDSILRLKKTFLVNMCPMYGNVYRIQVSTFNVESLLILGNSTYNPKLVKDGIAWPSRSPLAFVIP
jgi:hypothetical protein